MFVLFLLHALKGADVDFRFSSCCMLHSVHWFSHWYVLICIAI